MKQQLKTELHNKYKKERRKKEKSRKEGKEIEKLSTFKKSKKTISTTSNAFLSCSYADTSWEGNYIADPDNQNNMPSSTDQVIVKLGKDNILS